MPPPRFPCARPIALFPRDPPAPKTRRGWREFPVPVFGDRPIRAEGGGACADRRASATARPAPSADRCRDHALRRGTVRKGIQDSIAATPAPDTSLLGSSGAQSSPRGACHSAGTAGTGSHRAAGCARAEPSIACPRKCRSPCGLSPPWRPAAKKEPEPANALSCRLPAPALKALASRYVDYDLTFAVAAKHRDVYALGVATDLCQPSIAVAYRADEISRPYG